MAASSVSRGDGERPLQWTVHYSEKYDQCYIRITRQIAAGEAAASIVVSELWDAFDAVVLASHADANDRIGRSYCQVALSDDPFTSCMVSKFFIDEHMTH